MEQAEIAIIGSGPAGISAALNAALRGRSCLLFGSAGLSDKVQRSERIANYPGLPEIGGAELNARLSEQMKQAKIRVTEKRITGIFPQRDSFALLADQEQFDANAVILATGVETLRPIPGEREFLGRGVSYCATCDGMLYRGKTIAVICDSREAEEEAEFLARLAGKIYYQPLFRNSALAGKIKGLPAAAAEVFGDGRVRGLRLRDGTELPLDGVFFLKQSVSPAVLLPGLTEEEGHIAVNRKQETNVAGCFAAGDCTGTPYQIAKAVGEGNIAAHSAIQYLAKRSEKETEK